MSQSLLSSATHHPADKPKPRLRGALHALVAIIAVPATVLLALRARQGTSTRLALAYGAALILVFGTSGLYHMPLWPMTTRRRMRRLDHSMIYLLIAGSYAPFALQLDTIPRVVVLSIAIGGGLLGFIKAHAWERAPRVLTTGFYVLIGWCILPLLPQLYERIGLWRVTLLLLGGVLYTAGAVVYWLRRPNPWPRTFGYHEVNHAIGVIGAVAHYVAIWNLLT